MGKQSGLRHGLEGLFTLGASELIPGSVKDRLGKKPGTPGKNLDEALAHFANDILSDSRSTRSEYFSQLTDALTKGRVADLLPEQQFAIEGALSQGSSETKALTDTLAKNNLVQTPFGQRALASERLVANQRVGAAPADVINTLLLQAPAATLGQAQGIALGTGDTLANIAQQTQLARSQARAQAVGAIGQGVGGLLGAGITAYGGSNTAIARSSSTVDRPYL